MANKWRIPEEELKKLLERDKKCAYCDKKMIYPTKSKILSLLKLYISHC